MTTVTETADIETSSADYATRFAGQVGQWFLAVQERATLQLLGPADSGRRTILDVGGGHGQVTDALLRNGYEVTVLGSSEACRTRIQPFVDRGECSFQVGNILDLPYADRAFDVVLSYRLLPHVTQWKLFSKEVCRVAKATVLLDYPTVRSLNYFAPLLFGVKKRLEGNTRTYTCFRERELLEVFETQAFRRAGRHGEFFFPMVLHRMMRQRLLSAVLESGSRLLGLNHLFGSPVILKLKRVGD